MRTVPALVLALVLVACSGSGAETTTSAPAGDTTAPDTTTTVPDTTTVLEATTTTTVPLAEPEWDTWTLVLVSIPIGENAEADARAMAAAVPGSGVLLSNDYPSLNPDYWVVFFGAWEEQPSTNECPDLSDAFTCYPRFLGDPPAVSAYAGLGDALVELDTSDGSIIRTVDDFFAGDGVYRSGYALNPERTHLYYSEGWEDSWYSCESSPGQVGRINLETGVQETLWTGTGITVSDDGNFVAYLESSQCLPDPEQPDFWVLTPYDTVVVVDLVFNEPAFMTSAAPPTSYTDALALRWVRFTPDGEALVATADGTVYKVPLGAAPAIQDHPAVLTGVEGFPVGVRGNELVMSMWTGDSYSLVGHDLTSGEVTELWTTELWIEAGMGPDGSLIVGVDGVLYPWLDSAISVDAGISGVDW